MELVGWFGWIFFFWSHFFPREKKISYRHWWHTIILLIFEEFSEVFLHHTTTGSQQNKTKQNNRRIHVFFSLWLWLLLAILINNCTTFQSNFANSILVVKKPKHPFTNTDFVVWPLFDQLEKNMEKEWVKNLFREE